MTGIFSSLRHRETAEYTTARFFFFFRARRGPRGREYGLDTPLRRQSRILT